ncbi:MAG TPA: HD domain-containing phosphohydrolase [Mycobacteriales bacterium]|nr:HD domain-containing phosphohydrolase [Mycobacteriales bacterium]
MKRTEPVVVRRLLLVLAVGVAAAAAAASIIGAREMSSPADYQAAIAFCCLVAVGELLRVNLPGDRDAAPIGGAAVIGYALLVRVDGEVARHAAADVITVAAAGCFLTAIVHLLAQRDPRPVDIAARILGAATTAWLFRPWLADHPAEALGRPSTSLVVAMAIATLAGGAVGTTVAACERAARLRAPFIATLRNEVQAQLGLGAAMASTGILLALSVPKLGLWALLVFMGPLLVTQFSFRRYASISATYRQTIRALSRVTEVSGHVETGHSRRVMNLSVAMGREFGMTESELLDLEYAALMHDIGQLSLTDPIPRGSTLTVAPSERRRIAELGAAVIRSTGTMDRVAHIVGCQANAYRKMRETVDVEVPLPSRIVKTASAYDDLITASRVVRGKRASWDALERLRLGMAYEYDPRVIEALTKVLRRSGDL